MTNNGAYHCGTSPRYFLSDLCLVGMLSPDWLVMSFLNSCLFSKQMHRQAFYFSHALLMLLQNGLSKWPWLLTSGIVVTAVNDLFQGSSSQSGRLQYKTSTVACVKTWPSVISNIYQAHPLFSHLTLVTNRVRQLKHDEWEACTVFRCSVSIGIYSSIVRFGNSKDY